MAEPPSLINGLGGVKPSSTINKNLRRINPKPELIACTELMTVLEWTDTAAGM